MNERSKDRESLGKHQTTTASLIHLKLIYLNVYTCILLIKELKQ